MRTTFACAALVASFVPALALPAAKGEGFIGVQPEAAQGGHNGTDGKDTIVLLKDCDDTTVSNVLKQVGVKREEIDNIWENICGFQMKANAHCTDAFNAMTEVTFVEEKVDIQTFTVQQNSVWGLQRISSANGSPGANASTEIFNYTIEDNSALGAGVDIYVIDTGVRTSHAVFEDRATEGFSFTGSAADGDGHGTHVAGTAAGRKFGVAQKANIIAVKVLGDDGSGSSADTISGMDWVIGQHNKRKTQSGFVGSIMSMSWGLQGTADTVDQVILQAVEEGIHVSVAAGNDGADACLSTPSHNGGANSAVVTVGSINIDNEVSTFSNIGECVDIYAPGEQILSSWNQGDTIVNFLSGTSMACPHVSGVMAYLMAEDAATLGQDPAALKEKLLGVARTNSFTGSTGGGDALLLSNGENGEGNATRRATRGLVAPGGRRTVTGSQASWVKDFMNSNLDKRFQLHSSDSPLRY